MTHLSLIRQLSFCAGHRLYGHEGRCAFLHGHNYRVDIEVEAEGGGTAVDDVGRVVDFSLIKKRMLGWLDEHWDHSFLICQDDHNAINALKMVTPSRMFILPYNPTAENMAKYLLEEACPVILAGSGAQATRVRIWETDESYAEASVDPQSGTISSIYQEAISGD